MHVPHEIVHQSEFQKVTQLWCFPVGKYWRKGESSKLPACLFALLVHSYLRQNQLWTVFVVIVGLKIHDTSQIARLLINYDNKLVYD